MLTDHEGKFEFDQFTSSNTALLEVRKPGFYFGIDTNTSSTMLRADQLKSPVVVRLYPEALITGTLTSSDGTPLPQVFVSAMRRAYNDFGLQWFAVGHGMTNSHGEFRLAVPPGDYRIETNFSPRLRDSSSAVLPLIVPAPGSSGASGTIHMSSGTEQRFELHPVVSRTYAVGVRLDPLQERTFPILIARSSDGTVFPARVMRSGGPENPGEMRVALPSGTYTLIASVNRGDDVEYGEATVTVTDQDIDGIALHMAPVSPIPIQLVVDPDSASDKAPPTPQQLGLIMQNIQDSTFHIGNSTFMVMSQGGKDASLRPTPGVYRLTARSSGTWYVKSASYGTTDLLQQEMTVTAGGGSSPIVVTVSDQTGSLQGSVRQNDAPASAWVYAIPTSPSAMPVYTMHSGMDGSFTFSSLPPGTYQVVSFQSRYSADYRDPKAMAPFSSSMRSVTISSGNKATVDLNVVPDTEINP